MRSTRVHCCSSSSKYIAHNREKIQLGENSKVMIFIILFEEYEFSVAKL